eukprot:scaffold91522_cov61-Phaeocystis_antarctica.AAC.1
MRFSGEPAAGMPASRPLLGGNNKQGHPSVPFSPPFFAACSIVGLGRRAVGPLLDQAAEAQGRATNPEGCPPLMPRPRKGPRGCIW